MKRLALLLLLAGCSDPSGPVVDIVPASMQATYVDGRYVCHIPINLKGTGWDIYVRYKALMPDGDWATTGAFGPYDQTTEWLADNARPYNFRLVFTFNRYKVSIVRETECRIP